LQYSGTMPLPHTDRHLSWLLDLHTNLFYGLCAYPPAYCKWPRLGKVLNGQSSSNNFKLLPRKYEWELRLIDLHSHCIKLPKSWQIAVGWLATDHAIASPLSRLGRTKDGQKCPYGYEWQLSLPTHKNTILKTAERGLRMIWNTWLVRHGSASRCCSARNTWPKPWTAASNSSQS